MSIFAHRTKRPGRAKKISATAFFSHRGPSAGELVPLACSARNQVGRPGRFPSRPGRKAHNCCLSGGADGVSPLGRSAAENVRSALTRRPPRSYTPLVESAHSGSTGPARVDAAVRARKGVSTHRPTLANSGDASRSADGDAALSPLPGWKNQPGATPRRAWRRDARRAAKPQVSWGLPTVCQDTIQALKALASLGTSFTSRTVGHGSQASSRLRRVCRA